MVVSGGQRIPTFLRDRSGKVEMAELSVRVANLLIRCFFLHSIMQTLFMKLVRAAVCFTGV